MGSQLIIDNQKFYDSHLKLTQLTNVKVNTMNDKSKELGFHSEFNEENELKQYEIENFAFAFAFAFHL